MIGIIGDLGSGKSYLLQAILNNMIILKEKKQDENTKLEINNSSSQSPTRLVVNGSISYVAQNSWTSNQQLIKYKDY